MDACEQQTKSNVRQEAAEALLCMESPTSENKTFLQGISQPQHGNLSFSQSPKHQQTLTRVALLLTPKCKVQKKNKIKLNYIGKYIHKILRPENILIF